MPKTEHPSILDLYDPEGIKRNPAWKNKLHEMNCFCPALMNIEAVSLPVKSNRKELINSCHSYFNGLYFIFQGYDSIFCDKKRYKEHYCDKMEVYADRMALESNEKNRILLGRTWLIDGIRLLFDALEGNDLVMDFLNFEGIFFGCQWNHSDKPYDDFIYDIVCRPEVIKKSGLVGFERVKILGDMPWFWIEKAFQGLYEQNNGGCENPFSDILEGRIRDATFSSALSLVNKQLIKSSNPNLADNMAGADLNGEPVKDNVGNNQSTPFCTKAVHTAILNLKDDNYFSKIPGFKQLWEKAEKDPDTNGKKRRFKMNDLWQKTIISELFETRGNLMQHYENNCLKSPSSKISAYVKK